ncbi:MAG: hypothetical protein ACOYNI_07520 [Acidimicrobiia bacterium]
MLRLRRLLTVTALALTVSAAFGACAPGGYSPNTMLASGKRPTHQITSPQMQRSQICGPVAWTWWWYESSNGTKMLEGAAAMVDHSYRASIIARDNFGNVRSGGWLIVDDSRELWGTNSLHINGYWFARGSNPGMSGSVGMEKLEITILARDGSSTWAKPSDPGCTADLRAP